MSAKINGISNSIVYRKCMTVYLNTAILKRYLNTAPNNYKREHWTRKKKIMLMDLHKWIVMATAKKKRKIQKQNLCGNQSFNRFRLRPFVRCEMIAVKMRIQLQCGDDWRHEGCLLQWNNWSYFPINQLFDKYGWMCVGDIHSDSRNNIIPNVNVVFFFRFVLSVVQFRYVVSSNKMRIFLHSTINFSSLPHTHTQETK